MIMLGQLGFLAANYGDMKIGGENVLEKIVTSPAFVAYIALAAILAITASLSGNQGGCFRGLATLAAGGFVLLYLYKHSSLIEHLIDQPDLIFSKPEILFPIAATLLAMLIGWRSLH